MKLLMALGVLVWIGIGVWLARLAMGLDHISNNQIPIMLICGPVGGLAGWHLVKRHAEKQAKSEIKR